MTTELQKLQAAMAKVKVGKFGSVRVGPGRTGLITFKKGKKGVTPSLVRIVKRRAKVITSQKKKR